MLTSEQLSGLQARIDQLEAENAMLRRDFGSIDKGNMVIVPEAVKPLFDVAQVAVSEYFSHLKMDPTQGTIEINEQRYVLVRASALSKDFLDTIQSLYADRGPGEAMAIGKHFLFDIAHVIGMNDARAFHQKMNFTEPLAKLSAGPIHFAYSGWAFVEILPESNPTPDADFYLVYNHPYSFEADSWLRSGTKAETPVCIMNAGYSSGWCEESFGIPLTSVEVTCRAKGDAHCRFIMSPPDRIQEHLDRFHQSHTVGLSKNTAYEIPTFFERKQVEEGLQRARQLAEESVKTKSDFLANMSHELRTPLGAILGFTDLLKKTSLSDVQKDYLDTIHTSGNNLLSIINDILDLSKLDAGGFVIESIPFSIPELMHSVEVMFAARAAYKGLVLRCTTDLSISSYVLGDPMRLTQILTNLIGNAIKFTGQGSVQVNCRLERESAGRLFVTFSVKDTGIGIPKEKAAQVFERFTQADTDITRKYGGTGLGLAITRQLVELQGGTIMLESGPAAGATFHVALSYPVAAHAAVRAEKRAVMPPQLKGTKRILIVEDNFMNQKLTGLVLDNNGFESMIAENGAIAVNVLRQQAFDLVLMDIQMPVMDGYKAACAIRDELHLDLPIIAMTAHALEGEKDHCVRQGMNDYISKPYREEDLLEKLHYWLTKAEQSGAALPQKIIDFSFLLQQTHSNKSFILEMIGFFKEQHPKDMALLEAGIAAADPDAVYKATHRIRNTIGFFGLDSLVGPKLLQIEQLARAGKGMEEIAALFREVQPVSRQALRELAAPDPAIFG